MRLKPFIPFLAAFLLPLLLIYIWWGGFNPVLIDTTVSGPYTYAYQEHVGDYSKLPAVQDRVARELAYQEVSAGQPITVLFSNPDLVKRSERRAHVGFLVPEGTEVREPLQIERIPPRPTLVASVRAAILLAPSRAYQALDAHLQGQGRGIQMPTVELYTPSEHFLSMGSLRVEMTAP